MTPDEILVFDVLGLDVVTRPWFKPDDPSTHYSTLTTRQIEAILPRSRPSIMRGMRALKERGWLNVVRGKTYIVKFLKVTGNMVNMRDSEQKQELQEKQEAAGKVVNIWTNDQDEEALVNIWTLLVNIWDKQKSYVDQPIRFKDFRSLISLENKKELLEIYDSLNMRDGDMAKMASENDLLFSIHDFFLLVTERFGIVNSEGKPYLRGIPKSDVGVLFRAWHDHGPFACQIVEQALASSIAEQIKKGSPLPMAYHTKAIANLQAEEGHKYQMLRDDPKGKGEVKRLIEEFMGRSDKQ